MVPISPDQITEFKHAIAEALDLNYKQRPHAFALAMIAIQDALPNLFQDSPDPKTLYEAMVESATNPKTTIELGDKITTARCEQLSIFPQVTEEFLGDDLNH